MELNGKILINILVFLKTNQCRCTANIWKYYFPRNPSPDFHLNISLTKHAITRKWSLRLDIDSNIGVKISIFGPDEGTTTEGTSKNSEVLPSASLCEDDVALNSNNMLGRFITTYIVGNNERLRFIILQKQCWSRWAVILLFYNLLDSVSMIFNIHNVISSLIILLPLLLWKTLHVLHGSVCFAVAWIVCRKQRKCGSDIFMTKHHLTYITYYPAA